MKFHIVIAALATLLMPVYESTGFLTADFTQKACAASGGSIDPNRKGNQKCCNVPDARQGDFNRSCNGQKAENPNFHPTAQSC
ncbi:Hypothetical protein PHPALM_14231 [Phytophthora palmivora]|uniref:Uncharacterized protein n=1 Tax=Phytophthora palmivora TaxID=4796 RepID=A0A2P4XVJ5_9STRA|nr:Hypothetical protein PHPALM_14231 [Phytophthora palmivora]